MTRFLVAVCVLLILGSVAADVTQEEGVYVLTSDNFQEWISQQEFALVEFYAPWCGHCKNLAPHYANSAQALAGSTAALAKVDATENGDLGAQFAVQGYPTLIWFSDFGATTTPYSGPREHPGIADWVNRQTIKTLPVVECQADLDTLKATGITVALYGESAGYDDLVKTGRNLLDIAFVHVDNEHEFGAYANGDIVLYPTHTGPSTIQFTDLESLLSFISEKAFAPVVEFNQDNLKRLAMNGFAIIAIDDISNDEKKTSLLNTLDTVAASRVPQIGFMYGDSAVLGRATEGAGATGKVFPTIVAVNFETGAQLVWDEDLEWNAENVGKWCDGLLDGTTKQFVKSEPIPEDDGPLKTLVAKNFDSINGKKALVKYYAPWCGHCKNLAPIYDELAQNFADKDIIVAKIDATANYVAAQVQGYPTLIYYNEQGTPETYEGARTLEGMSEFLNSKL